MEKIYKIPHLYNIGLQQYLGCGVILQIIFIKHEYLIKFIQITVRIGESFEINMKKLYKILQKKIQL